MEEKLTESEKKVLKALDRIGGGGTPIDIAFEGLLDIKKTRNAAERLWGKGYLLSHRVRDPDEKRFFSFSEMGEETYKKLLKELDDES